MPVGTCADITHALNTSNAHGTAWARVTGPGHRSPPLPAWSWRQNQGQDGEEIERQSISGELQTHPALEKIGQRGRL